MDNSSSSPLTHFEVSRQNVKITKINNYNKFYGTSD